MIRPRFPLGSLRGSGRHQGAPARKPMRFRPAAESLEGRLALAGNVTTSLVAGNLTLSDNGDISLKISQPAANKITLTPAAAGTTINGQAGPVTITGVTGNLTANLGSGNDTLNFDLSNAGISVRNLSITGSTGNKSVQTTTAGSDNFLNVHGNYKQVFGDGNESTRLDQFHVDRNMTINHANGGSFVFLRVDPTNLGTQFNSVGGDLVVNNVTQSGQAASGFDVNALEETNVGGDVVAGMGLAQSGGSSNGIGGWTSVGSRSAASVSVGGDVALTALNGFLSFGDFANDSLEVRNAKVGGDVTMNLGTGVGNTALFGGGTSAESTTAHSLTIMGQGAHDGVTVGASQVMEDLAVSLAGRGANSIALDSVHVGGDTSLMTAGGHGSIAIDDQAPGSKFDGRTDITMTGRNNLLSINSKHRSPSTGATAFAGRVMARLGSGNDTLILAEIGQVSFGAQATFNGGSGRNTALVNAGDITGVQPTLVNFS